MFEKIKGNKLFKTSILVISIILFLSVTSLIFIKPDRTHFFFPLYGCIVVLVAWSSSNVGAGLIVGLISIAGITFWSRIGPADGPVILWGIPVFWGIWALMQELDKRQQEWSNVNRLQGGKLQQKVNEIDKELEYYRRRVAELEAQSAHRRHLSFAARDLGGTLDSAEIQRRLLRIVHETFPKGVVHLSGSEPSDHIDSWTMERRQPFFSEDISQDTRFSHHGISGIRSAMAVPLVVESSLVGILRVTSEKAGQFTRDDLRVLDFLSGMASLTLDNSLLFSRIQEMAIRDGLTGLFNHREFHKKLGDEILRAGRYKYPISVILFDVDHFKSVNDVYGHQAGDMVLVRIGQIIPLSLRSVDIVARYGGEEFIILLPQMALRDAYEQAERLRNAVMNESYISGDQTFSVTISGGVSAFPDEATTAQQLIRLADQRLYAAKISGRNRIVMEEKR